MSAFGRVLALMIFRESRQGQVDVGIGKGCRLEEAMLDFMDYVQNAFLQTTRWDRDNSYGALNATSQNILDFRTPHSVRLNVSSLSSPNFASSYSIGSVGLLNGSVSYLHTSRSLAKLVASSSQTNLRFLVPGYRQLRELKQSDYAPRWEIWHQGKRIDRRDALLYGRLYLPQSTLEALYMCRLTPKSQLGVSCVSDSSLPNGGTILAHIEHDAAKYCTEYLYSTDSALFGMRGLYNFGTEAAEPITMPSNNQDLNRQGWTSSSTTTEKPHGRFSIGGEIYYGLLNKSGGLSTGLRFATLPSHTAIPYTMTLTLNPLMGNLRSTYSVLASPRFALSSRFDFNVYSYESELQIGTELWRRKERQANDGLDWARSKLGLPPKEIHGGGEALSGCLKARLDQRGSLALLWEGRIKELLYSCGATIDLKGGENMFKGVGLELHYSP